MFNYSKVSHETDFTKILGDLLTPVLDNWARTSLPSLLPQAEPVTSHPDFLTKDQAREYLGKISMVTLDKLVREKKIIPCRPSPDRMVFSREDLKTYLLNTKAA